jgi:hypothetical protein
VTRRLHAVLCVVVLAGCTAGGAARRGIRPGPPPSARAIVAALAEREAATPGLRLSMTVRLTGTGQDPLLPSPAYLAIDDGGGIRLQVLSAFGMTVLDLAIHGDGYTVTLPLTHETRDGTIDLATLSDPAVPVADRMIVALALMFRPKARTETCHGTGPATVTCTVGSGLTAQVTVDDHLRPIRETYLDAGATPLLAATFVDYRGDDTRAQPGSLVIEDAATGARMAIQVKRVRTAGTAA